MIKLTYEEAIELGKELSVHCVSYYNATLRSALDKTIEHCKEIIDEHEEILLDNYNDEERNV